MDRRRGEQSPEDVAAVAAVRGAAADVTAASRHNRINMLWEYTQALLAMSLVLSTVIAALVLGHVPETLRNATFVVIGFYFGRTNHTRPTPGDRAS